VNDVHLKTLSPFEAENCYILKFPIRQKFLSIGCLIFQLSLAKNMNKKNVFFKEQTFSISACFKCSYLFSKSAKSLCAFSSCSFNLKLIASTCLNFVSNSAALILSEASSINFSFCPRNEEYISIFPLFEISGIDPFKIKLKGIGVKRSKLSNCLSWKKI
jgi:hypothetical protein